MMIFLLYLYNFKPFYIFLYNLSQVRERNLMLEYSDFEVKDDVKKKPIFCP